MTTIAGLELPALRQELQIVPGSPLLGCAPSWTLFDPIRHLFYQIGRAEFRILSLWSRGDVDSIRAGLATEGYSTEEADRAIGRVLQF